MEENGERVPAGVVTLASVLQSRGYKTAAFIGSDFLDRRYGLDQGFDDYDSPFGLETTGVANPLAMSLRRDGALVVRAARQWLEAHRGQPVFVFVHLFDLHTPYTLPAEVARQQGISRYDAQLEYVDQVMGRFQQELMQERVVGEVTGGGVRRPRRRPGRPPGNRPRLLYLREHAARAADRALAGKRSKLETRNSKLENRNWKFGRFEFRVSIDFEFRLSTTTPCRPD